MAELEMSQSYADASEDDRKAVSNGCGPSGLAHVIPDNLLGADIHQACEIHDWDYGEGATQDDRKAADERFLRNMKAMVDAEGGFVVRILRRVLAWWYFRAVRKFGSDAFFRRL